MEKTWQNKGYSGKYKGFWWVCLGYNGNWFEVLGMLLGNSGTCSGTCLELSITDNQIVNRGNGTKCGTCLGQVGGFWGNFVNV